MSAPLLLHKDDEEVDEPLLSRSITAGAALVGWGWTKITGVDVVVVVLTTSPLERGSEADASARAAVSEVLATAFSIAAALLAAVAGVPLLTVGGGLLSVPCDRVCRALPKCVGASCWCDGGG